MSKFQSSTAHSRVMTWRTGHQRHHLDSLQQAVALEASMQRRPSPMPGTGGCIEAGGLRLWLKPPLDHKRPSLPLVGGSHTLSLVAIPHQRSRRPRRSRDTTALLASSYRQSLSYKTLRYEQRGGAVAHNLLFAPARPVSRAWCFDSRPARP